MATTQLLSVRLELLMSSLGLSAIDLARALETSDRTVARWLADETYPQHDSRDRLDKLIRLDQRLAETFTTQEAAVAWLQSESGYFGGLAPNDALLRGRIDAVEAALDALDAGIFV
jgi:transcriptional regulator with XRE-family HTH domain